MTEYIAGLASTTAGVRLTPKRRQFLTLYFGEARQNPTEACKLMGIPRADVAGSHYKVALAKVIEELQLKSLEVGLLSAQEAMRQISWLALHASSESNQLRALELVIKVHGLLTDKVSLTLDRKQLEQDMANVMANLKQDVGDARLVGSQSHQDER